ncbi:MAG TPA: hypothetical protein VH255_06780 [Verrucomicrobiae bacterium]|nr:hypothetical protein [Verrucomicrobiae bacterium]
MKRCVILGFVAAAGFVAGCSKPVPPAATEVVHQHEHHAPHGGTPVELGDEENHVEFVLDSADGKLQAYILDGELEDFIRIKMPALKLTAHVSGAEQTLVLRAVANGATGETVGDTSLFETQADWLKTTPQFDAVLDEITVQGKTYTNVTFNFPKGSDENAKK